MFFIGAEGWRNEACEQFCSQVTRTVLLGGDSCAGASSIGPAFYSLVTGRKSIIDYLAKARPQAKGLNPNDFVDPSILKEIEESGFVKRYGK